MVIRSIKHEFNVAHYTISRVKKSYTSLKNIIKTFIQYALSNLECRNILFKLYKIVTKILFITYEYESIS